MPPKKPRKAANGYRLPDPIPAGEVISAGKKSWRLGRSVGVGGFGEIYLCTEIAANSNCRATSASFDDSAPLAVKIEPVRVKTSCTDKKTLKYHNLILKMSLHK